MIADYDIFYLTSILQVLFMQKCVLFYLSLSFMYTKVQIYLNHFSTQVYHCGESYEVQTNVRYIHV